ncbi:MAG: T9SS type A sorting domain-containing protein, partial [Sediminibacterium sp.]
STTYYVASVSAAGCESAARTSVTVTVNPLPSIDIPVQISRQSVRPGKTTTKLYYENKQNNPDKYSINWPDGGAANIIDGILEPDSIEISGIVLVEGTYLGKYTVKNSITSCSSQEKDIEIYVNSDGSPPEVRFISPSSYTLSGDVTVTFEISDGESGISEAKLSFGKAEENNFSTSNIEFQTINGNERRYTINTSNFNELGIRLRAYAKNGAGLEKSSDIINITVRYENYGHTIPYSSPGKSIKNYQIISIPLNLNNKTVNDIFSDNLGVYNPYVWRMFRYDNGQITELNGIAQLNPGIGYWFITSKSTIIDTGPGLIVGSYDQPASIPVRQGWNLIGNPYPFNLNWTDVLAANPGLNLGNLKVYRTGTFTESNRLNEFEGAYVFANNTGSLIFPARKNPSANGGRTIHHEDSVAHFNNIKDNDWRVNFTLNNSMLTNKLAGFGMAHNAKEDYDPLDDFTLPRLSDYLELNHNKTHHGISYSQDIVPHSEEWEWNFSIVSSSDDAIRLSWENQNFDNINKDLLMWHHEKQLPVWMSEINHYVFSAPATFTIYYGYKDKLAKKTVSNSIYVFDPFPNPASDKITVIMYIPENTVHTKLLFNLLNSGGLSLELSKNPTVHIGYNEITMDLDRNKLSSGVYILQIHTSNGIINKKILISRTH